MGKMKFRIEPELQYCPQCQDEYRAGVTLCATCGVVLLSGRQMLESMEQKNKLQAGRPAEITTEDELVDIVKGKIIDVKSTQSILNREGIPSIIAGDSSACGKGCGGTDVKLQVRMTDLREVMALLAKEHVHSTALNDHDTSYVDAVYNPEVGDATCPACGCNFSTKSNACPDCGLCF